MKTIRSDENWEGFKSGSLRADPSVHAELDDFLETSFPDVVLDKARIDEIPVDRYFIEAHKSWSDKPLPLKRAFVRLFDPSATGFVVGWAPTPFAASLWSLLALSAEKKPRFAVAPEGLHLFSVADLCEVPIIQATIAITPGNLAYDALGELAGPTNSPAPWEVVIINASRPTIMYLDDGMLQTVEPRIRQH